MFLLSTSLLQVAELSALVQDPGCGGHVAFEGWVRDNHQGRAVTALRYEAYEALCLREGDRILSQALERFGVRKAVAAHRVGEIGVGGLVVWVGVSSPHRAEAFRACEWIIGRIKHELPIWKLEHFADGESLWVGCDRCSGHHADPCNNRPAQL